MIPTPYDSVDPEYRYRALEMKDAYIEGYQAALAKTYCAYCGAEFSLSDPEEAKKAITEHIYACDKHPLHEVLSGVLRIRCMRHRDVPQYNANEANGGECCACAFEAAQGWISDTILFVAGQYVPAGIAQKIADAIIAKLGE